jgi:hypothetical protein
VIQTPKPPDGAESSPRRGRSRTRLIAGVLLAALVVAVGAVIGQWQTRPPADDPGPDDPIRRSSRPW